MDGSRLQSLRSSYHCDVLTVAAGLPVHNGYAVDFIEAVAAVVPEMPLRLLQLRLEQLVILVVRSFVYRELTRQVIIDAVTSRRCQVYTDACLPNAMRGMMKVYLFSLTTSCLRQG